MTCTIPVYAAVEGLVDEAVIRRIVESAGANLSRVHGKTGKQGLLKNMRGYDNAARLAPWIVIVDLDNDGECAPALLHRLVREGRVPDPSHLCVRVAVREVEAWLLADHEGLARFLSVAPSLMPVDPDSVGDPKRVMVDLARRSRKRAIREDMVPRPGSGRAQGRAYTSRLIEFVGTPGSGWRPDVGARRSDSLRRCIDAVRELVRKG
ncbi:MAG: DUF4276 family protein [Actinobacteria bacterium]|nr:DUF4276 family protein [Actinomycetota bacterium]